MSGFELFMVAGSVALSTASILVNIATWRIIRSSENGSGARHD